MHAQVAAEPLRQGEKEYSALRTQLRAMLRDAVAMHERPPPWLAAATLRVVLCRVVLLVDGVDQLAGPEASPRYSMHLEPATPTCSSLTPSYLQATAWLLDATELLQPLRGVTLALSCTPPQAEVHHTVCLRGAANCCMSVSVPVPVSIPTPLVAAAAACALPRVHAVRHLARGPAGGAHAAIASIAAAPSPCHRRMLRMQCGATSPRTRRSSMSRSGPTCV